jgi:hypothetical protein
MSTTEMPRNAGPAAGGAPRAPSSTLAPRRRQRRNGRLALAGALVALFAVGTPAAWVYFSATESVVGLSDGVRYGQAITAGDLVEMSVPTGSGINALGWAQRDSVIGQVATTDLQAGQLLPTGATTGEIKPAKGSSIVAVGVKAAFLPAAELTAGDTVRIVAVQTTPGTTPADPKYLPSSIAATVYSISRQAADGTTVVSVTVSDANADAVARLSAVGQAALVLLPRG